MKVHEAENMITAKCSLRCSKQPLPADVKTVLKELFNLLERYAPTWYTQDHHDRAVIALNDE